jgi:hypothetical protein
LNPPLRNYVAIKKKGKNVLPEQVRAVNESVKELAAMDAFVAVATLRYKEML